MSYKYFTFGDVDMTPIIEEYAQILNFPNDPHKVYFRPRIRDTVTGSITNRGLSAKTTLKTDKDKGKLREERYQAIAFAIFGLVLFTS